MCEECMPENFVLGKNCYNCSMGCSNCTLDQDALWTEASLYLNNTIGNLAATMTAQGVDTSQWPAVDSQSMDLRSNVMYMEVYALIKTFLRNSSIDEMDLMNKTIPLMIELRNSTLGP